MTVHRGRVQAKREVSWTRKKKLAKKSSRGGSELEASPEEINIREVELGERESWTSFALVVSQRRNYGHCLCNFILHSSWDRNCMVRWSLRNAGHCLNILLFWWRSTAALVFRVGVCFEVSLFCPPFPLVPVPNRPPRLRGR